MESRYVDQNHQSTEDPIAQIAFGEHNSLPYEYNSSVLSGKMSNAHGSYSLDKVLDSNMFSLGAKRNTGSGRQSEAQHQPHRDTHQKIKETYDVYRKSISTTSDPESEDESNEYII